MPSLPDIVLNLIQIVNNPYSNSSQIVDILEKDIGLSSRILRVANSAYYGIPRKVDDLKLAIVIIGMEEVANLISTSSLLRLFPPRPGESGFNYREFWHHSITCGEVAQVLAAAVRYPRYSTAHIAGLLHDIGKLFLNQFFYHYFTVTLEESERNQIPYYQAELQLLGVDHGHIGAWIGERWNIPEEITSAIAQHHIRASDTPPYSLSFIIDWANQLTHRIKGYSQSEATQLLYNDTQFTDWLRGKGAGLHAVVAEIFNRLDKSAKLREFL